TAMARTTRSTPSEQNLTAIRAFEGGQRGCRRGQSLLPLTHFATLDYSTMLLGEWGAFNSPGRSLENDDVDVVRGAPGHRVPVERVVDLVENFQGIGTVVALKQSPEP